MDEFLKIVGMNHIQNSSNFNKDIENIYEPIKNKLKRLLSQELYAEIEESLDDAITESDQYCFVEGMKVSMNIIDKKYVPTL